MPATKKRSSRGGKTAGKRPATGEPAAVARLNKSLDAAQDALAALRNDVSKDVSTGARDLYKDVQKFVKDARRDSGRLGKALQRDIEKQTGSDSVAEGTRQMPSNLPSYLMRDGPGCRLALPVVGGPIRGRRAKLNAEPARKVTGRGEADEFGDLIQFAFAVGQILLGELSTYSIDDC